jgi:hypothetical protein
MEPRGDLAAIVRVERQQPQDDAHKAFLAHMAALTRRPSKPKRRKTDG